MEEVSIDQTLVKIEDSTPLRSNGGKGVRRKNMPYFIKLKNGEFWQEILTEETDDQLLFKQIEQGRIWILKQHFEK